MGEIDKCAAGIPSERCTASPEPALYAKQSLWQCCLEKAAWQWWMFTKKTCKAVYRYAAVCVRERVVLTTKKKRYLYATRAKYQTLLL